MKKTREQVHDELIVPLMLQIRDICKANNIPVVAVFGLASKEHPETASSSIFINPDCDPPQIVTTLALVAYDDLKANSPSSEEKSTVKES